MKVLPLLATAALLITASLANAQSTSTLMSEAQRAYISGDLDMAKKRFNEVLAVEPQNKSAQNYLRMIRAAEAKSGPGGGLQKKLTGLVLPQVNLKSATFSSALEYLKQLAEKEGTNVSFVTQLPEATLKEPVTLALSNVPFTEVLRYLGDLARVKFTVEQYAISVTPLEP